MTALNEATTILTPTGCEDRVDLGKQSQPEANFGLINVQASHTILKPKPRAHRPENSVFQCLLGNLAISRPKQA